MLRDNDYAKNSTCFPVWMKYRKLKLKTGDSMRQIQEKEYFQKYRHAGKTIVLIGANFDSVSLQITDWKTEEIPA